MGIIEQYLEGNNEPTATKAVKAKSIIDQYINEPEKTITKPKNSDPKPPISGISKESSDELNKTREEKLGGENPREGMVSVPVKAGKAVGTAFVDSALTAGSGIADTFSGKPATGVGKIGTGLMGLVGSPFEGIGSMATDLTGNPEFGNKASLLAGGALPVKYAAPYIPLRIPTLSNLNPITKPSVSKNKAFNELVDKITSGGRDQQALVDTVAAMKADSRIGPADTSPAVLSMTQKLFTTEGDVAKNYLHNTSKSRMEKLPEDVHKAFDELAGAPVNVVQKLADLSAASKKAGTDIINPAIKNAGPVDISNTVDAIDGILKVGVWKKLTAESSLPLGEIKNELQAIKGMLSNKKEMRTNADDLHHFQYKLRERAESLLGSAVGSERELGKELMKVRNNVVNDIDAASPRIMIDGKETGQYKHGLNSFREEKDIANSFREGYHSSAKGMDKDPAVTKVWFDSLTDAEKEAAREGRRLAISHTMGKSNNPSLAGTNASRSEFNIKENEIFFGKEGTEKLLRDLENTRAIKNTHTKVIEGSQTEMRAAGDDAVALSKDRLQPPPNALNKYALPVAAAVAEMATGQTGMAALALTGLGGASKLLSKGNAKIRDLLEKERNVQLAKYALPTEGPSRDALIKSLEAAIPGPKQSMLSRVANRLPIAQ